MYLKIMGPENAPDADTRKTYRIYECSNVNFFRDDEDKAHVWVDTTDDHGFMLPLEGNAYLMNDNGKTVSAFGCAPLGKDLFRPGPPETGEGPR